MLRSVLNASEEAAICGETHFLGAPRSRTTLQRYLLNQKEYSQFYRQIRLLKTPPAPGSWQSLTRIGDISTHKGAQDIVDYIYDTRPLVWRWWDADQIDRTKFMHNLLASERTERSFFNLVMRAYANDKPICGEKTPHHIHHVPTLLEWFPEAKIVHLLRDVRAVFVSQQKKKFKQERGRLPWLHQVSRQSAVAHQVYMSINVIIQWLRVVQLHYQYQQLYPHNYYLCKYEDFINEPETQLKRLCDWLDINSSQKMLEQTVQNSSFIPRHQVQGFDQTATDRWRQHLHPTLNWWLVLWSKKYLREFEYQL